MNQAFLEAVIDLLKHPEKQEFLRREALAIKPTFGWDRVAKQWQDEFFLI
ncbi:MAG: hypothetical protein ACP5RH_22200 [Leptodesmis sp.]